MRDKKDFRVLFVITNVNGTYGDAYSIGLAAIAAVIAREGYGYDYDLINQLDEVDGFIDRVAKFDPQVIAYTSVSSQHMFINKLSKQVGERFGGKIRQVCGGVHVTIYPDALLDSHGLDGIIIGEGEYGFRDFVARVFEGRDFHDVKNFCYVKDGKVVKNEKYPLVEKLDELPYLERTKYQYEKFTANDDYAMFFFSRGCPFICTYCSNHALASAYDMITYRPRYRTPEDCIKEIQDVAKRYTFSRVFIGDDTFGVNKKWMKDFCELYGREIKIPLIVQLRVNLVNDLMMECLRTAGCAHVSCGVEAGNPYIRNTIMKRNLTDKQLIDAYDTFKKFGITANAINMIGVPGETEETIWDTINLNRRLAPDSSGINIFYPYLGTDLGDYCIENGLVDKGDLEDFNSERRESVLKFPAEFKEKLVYYHRNWDDLVYANDPKRRLRLKVKKFMTRHAPRVWDGLRAVKRTVLRKKVREGYTGSLGHGTTVVSG